MRARMRKAVDKRVEKVIEVLRVEYQERQPQARIHVRRRNSYTIDVRVVDRSFARKNKTQRFDRVWDALERGLDDRLLGEIGYVLLLTPKEAAGVFAKAAFDEEGAIAV